MSHVLADHGLAQSRRPSRAGRRRWRGRSPTSALAVLGLEAGFETADLAVISEQDILGDRLVRPPPRLASAPEDFIAEVTSLDAGDLVVHVDHGIGRFVGLQTIEAAGAPHDCLELHYAEAATSCSCRSRTSSFCRATARRRPSVQLDRLGGAGWQTRKARMKNRIREMAGELIKIAAARLLREAPRLTAEHGLYDEFCAGFPYDETEDQETAIDAVLDDLGSGRPMDRLICGDVGFGKTEVALRAAFVDRDERQAGRRRGADDAAGAPALQDLHRALPRLSGQGRAGLAPGRRARSSRPAKQGLADGQVDIVVGTHALLGKAIRFKDLGLLVVDEEQHFGVAHKEKLKTLRAEVHVLTLTATPIPRTLQLALTGVRELSIIASPPVDRLAVRTFVSPFDPLVVREALLRERYRGGQAFYVCPRIEDLAEAKDFLDKTVPEVRVAVAHGQMPRDRARRHHVGVLRRQVRRAALDHDRRIRPRHPDRQHADRASRRHVRPGAALSAARPRRALQDARLRAVHAAGEPAASPRRPSGG